MSEDKACREAFEEDFAGLVFDRHPSGYYKSRTTQTFWEGYQAAWSRAAKPAVPEVLFDGYAVLQALSEKAKTRTSPENVSDVLDAAVKLIRAAAPTPPETAKEPT